MRRHEILRLERRTGNEPKRSGEEQCGEVAARPAKRVRRQVTVRRALDLVKLDPETGCWEWQGYRDRKGYGQFRCGGHVYWAHRAAFAMFSRAGVSADQHVHHTCFNPRCVNSSHLCEMSPDLNSRTKRPHIEDPEDMPT